MHKIAMTIALTALTALASGSAAASDKTDVMAVVHHWVDTFNKGDAKGWSANCTDDAVIVDDFAPHVWQGSGTCAKWYADFEALASKNSMTEPKVAFGKPKRVDLNSGYAYVVTPATFSYEAGGKLTNVPSLVTISMKKSDAGWHITSWAWADL